MASKRSEQRPAVAPPFVSLKALRKACHLTLEEVCARVADLTDQTLTRGALSAIENGHRGASRETLEALARAYDIDVADFEASHRLRKSAA